MMQNRILALLALLALAAFLGILVWKVPRLDLGIVVAGAFLLAAYDFLRTAFLTGRQD